MKQARKSKENNNCHRQRNIFRLLFALCNVLFLLFSGCSTPIVGHLQKEATEAPDPVTVFQEIALRFKVPGAVLGMRTADGKRVLSSYGYADLDKGLPMEVDHRFRVGSITKTFTAAGILKLVEKGTLSLEQTVDSILPGKVPGGKNLTLRMLLQMRSGLSDYSEHETFNTIVDQDPLHKWSFEELIQLVAPADKPNKVFAYRNINYHILGKIIETVSRVSYGEYLNTTFFIPLGLKNTFVPAGPEMVAHSAIGYLDDDEQGRIAVGEAIDPSWAGPAGNIVSTVPDLMIWLNALQRVGILEKKSLAEMNRFRPGILGGDLTGYGLGWLDRKGAVGHGGNYADIYTGAMFTYQGVEIVLLVNGKITGSSGDATDLFYAFVEEFLPAASAGK